MNQRHQPIVQRHEVNSAVTVYIPKSAPRDVSVSIFNEGPQTALIYFHPSDPAVQLAAGAMLTANPDDPVVAESVGTSIVVATGVKVMSTGAASTGALSGSELAALAEARTQKELLVEILLQAKLGNLYLGEMFGERFRTSDLD